jgi:DNA-binding CsgD family transcriptional regulator/tetratricopeptide (TPR) repeat protein
MVRTGEHLVGRAETCSVFDESLLGLAHGPPPAALALIGGPGIGKTRLLAEAAARADAHGYLVLRGAASELERDLPFWVFVDALDEHVRGLEPHALDALDDGTRDTLAEILPSLSSPAGSRAAPVLHDRYRVHAAVRDLLERLAAATPLVLLADDLHWADAASIELFGALLRRPPDAPVLIAASLRPRQVPVRLSAAVERAHRSGVLRRIEIGALTQPEARALLDDGVDEATAQALYEESGGNPFYLEQLARSPRARLCVPAPVAADLAEELALLGDDARLALDGAAVAGDPFDPELAAAAGGMTESSALAAVDELLSLDLVHGTGAPRRFRFRHPIVQRAVYESTPAAWRLGAHERSAKALAARGAPVAERAHHVERSARRGDADARLVLRDAAESLAHRAPAVAARWLDVALGLLPDEGRADERVRLLLARAEVHTASALFSDSHAALLESIRVVGEGDAGLRVQLATACAGVEHLLGRHEDAHDRLTSGLDDLDQAVSPEGIELMLGLALDGLHRMEFDAMGDWAGRAATAAAQLGDPRRALTSTALASWAAGLCGLLAEAEIGRAEAAGAIDAMPDSELAVHLGAATYLAGAEVQLERFAEAHALSERVVAIATATGQPAFVPRASMLHAWVSVLRGGLARSGEVLDAAIGEARAMGNAHSIAGLLLNRSLTALAAGELDVAVTAAQESIELIPDGDGGLVAAASAVALAESLLEAGDPGLGEAVSLLLERAGGPELELLPGPGFRARSLELLTRCWLALGRPADARRAATFADAAADGCGLPLARAMADRAAAAIALHSGDASRAARLALASAVACDAAAIPIEAGLSRTLAGRALSSAGQTRRAVLVLERAASDLHASGAVRYRNAADQELRRLGRHIHRRTRPGEPAKVGVASLTAREREVAWLVVDRRTNPQIAEGLYLSPKTIETHLSNIFRKLGVSSRVEVARAVERAE